MKLGPTLRQTAEFGIGLTAISTLMLAGFGLAAIATFMLAGCGG